jgi:hypothetical protein
VGWDGDGNPEAAVAEYWGDGDGNGDGDGEEHPSGLPFAARGASLPVASLPVLSPTDASAPCLTRTGWADHVVLACCMCVAVGVA